MKTFNERRERVENYMEKIKRNRRHNIAVVTSVCLVVAVLAMVLFIPYDTTPPDVSMYAGSDYYQIIQRLNEATYQKPKYKNNFAALLDNLDFGLRKGSASLEDFLLGGMPMAPGAPNYGTNGDNYAGESNPTGNQYQEVTDNQVEGVIEADLLKRSDKYAFYLRDRELLVYSVDGEESALISAYEIDAFAETKFFPEWGYIHYYANTTETMYLSMDCNTLTVLLSADSAAVGTCTAVVNLDVSDPTNITMRDCVYFEGGRYTSRMVDDKILLSYDLTIYKNKINFDDPTTFVPQYGVPGNLTCIPADNIVCPEVLADLKYTVVCMLDSDTLELMGCTALLGYAQELYVSEDIIYLTHSYRQKSESLLGTTYTQTAMTEITGIGYSGDTLEILGTVTLEGSVKDQYSMDQHEGILRVVTSTAVTTVRETVFDGYASLDTNERRFNVNLYCVDVNTWEIAASVIGFAPDGEDAQSVRFDGYNAYVCTAEVITITDPVYFFDLSDLNNITWKDTGTIDGYSTSLIELGDGYLLGIGYGDKRHLKVEVYEEAEEGVVSVCSYEQDVAFSIEYKSYLIDRESDLIGIPVYYYVDGEGYVEYRLLRFDGETIQEILIEPMSNEISIAVEHCIYNTRAFIADGYLYVFSDVINGFSVRKIA